MTTRTTAKDGTVTNGAGTARMAAIYVRQSIDRDGNELAVTRQREDLEKLCAAKGWTPILYSDNDTSASTGRKRPGYEAMLADIAAGMVGAVAVWDLDRLHRQPIELEHFITLADVHKVALATVTGEADLSTDNGRLYARIKGAVARAEVERKGARQKRAAQQRAEAGKAWTPVRWFGYTMPNSDGTGVTVIEAEAKVLRKLYTDVLAGRSMMSLARELNANGVKSVRGNAWSTTALRDVLLSPRNAGFRHYRNEIVGQGLWPAIVDEDIWRGVVAVLTDPARTRRPAGGYGRKHLLTGLVVCGKCGSRIGSSRHTANNKSIYVCRRCQGASRMVEKLDDYVLRVVAERLSRADAAELLVDHDRADVAELHDMASALRKRQDELAELFAAGDIDASQLRTGTASFRSQLESIESKLLDASKTRIFSGVIGASDVRAALEAMPLDRRRAIVSALLVVTVMPGQPSRGPLRTALLPVHWLS